MAAQSGNRGHEWRVSREPNNSASVVRHLWLTYCKSLHDHLVSLSTRRSALGHRPSQLAAGSVDVARRTELSVWSRTTSGKTSVCLTKARDLRSALESCYVDVAAAPSSVATQIYKSDARKLKQVIDAS